MQEAELAPLKEKKLRECARVVMMLCVKRFLGAGPEKKKMTMALVVKPVKKWPKPREPAALF